MVAGTLWIDGVSVREVGSEEIPHYPHRPLGGRQAQGVKTRRMRRLGPPESRTSLGPDRNSRG
jgi:hypothetical protein